MEFKDYSDVQQNVYICNILSNTCSNKKTRDEFCSSDIRLFTTTISDNAQNGKVVVFALRQNCASGVGNMQI